jgi:hypothetical protein
LFNIQPPCGRGGDRHTQQQQNQTTHTLSAVSCAALLTRYLNLSAPINNNPTYQQAGQPREAERHHAPTRSPLLTGLLCAALVGVQKSKPLVINRQDFRDSPCTHTGLAHLQVIRRLAQRGPTKRRRHHG